MPLLVKDYTWSENANEVIIDIPLKGTKKKVDILSTDDYLKVSRSLISLDFLKLKVLIKCFEFNYYSKI